MSTIPVVFPTFGGRHLEDMAPRQAPDTYMLTRLSNSRHAPFQTSPPQHEHFLHCCAGSGHQETDAYATEAAARAVRAQCARNSHGTQISFWTSGDRCQIAAPVSEPPKGVKILLGVQKYVEERWEGCRTTQGRRPVFGI